MVSAQLYVVLEVIVVKLVCPCDVLLPTAESGFWQWCIAKNGGGYTQRGVAMGLKVPCLFMITEVSIRCQKNPGGWYTPYTRVYPPIHHWLLGNLHKECCASTSVYV